MILSHYWRVPTDITHAAALAAKTHGTVFRSVIFMLSLNILAQSLPITHAADSDRSLPGILGRRAPEWSVDQWHNLPEGKSSLDVTDYRGKVLCVFNFQSVCPGCHRYGFPTLQKLVTHYKPNEEVAFVAVQTAFELFHRNNFAAAQKIVSEFDLDIPVGHSGARADPSELMDRYRTAGTPWFIIIDRDGIVRFNNFHLDADKGIETIDTLLATPAKGDQAIAIPESRGSRDMIGRALPLDTMRWLNTDGNKPLGTKGKVTLVRWWTDTCSYCERSLPAITALSKKYATRGFQTVGVYHAKPPRAVKDDTVIKAAADLSYVGPIALDTDWSVLKDEYLSRRRRPATSVSFLLDCNGRIRFVHPGPEFHPSDDPGARQIHQDHLDIDATIQVLLEERDQHETP
jgi:thiol-disulfide isomerase/thioredoxin